MTEGGIECKMLEIDMIINIETNVDYIYIYGPVIRMKQNT